jgi:2-polyprenyl-3-methyl-5-hydroxy-6-metoxy-1,4-benzoquinol methylase
LLTCLACGEPSSERWAEGYDEEYLTTKAVFTYRKCNRCGALSIDPVPREQLSRIYPPNYYSFDEQVTGSLVFKAKDWLDQRFYRGFLSQFSQSEIGVLDIGGGSGTQLSSLRKIDPRITHTAIVDLDEKAGESARQQGHEYFCGRFEDYSPGRTFDVVLMLNLIEHVDNPGDILRKAHSVLSPEGIVLIKTPNTDSLDARLFRNRNWGGYHCPRHWVLFNRQNLQALVERAGLKVHYFQYTQGAPFWTTSIMFAMSRRGWIRVSRERPVPKHPLYPILNIVFASLDLVRGKVAKTSQMQLILRRA